MFTGEVIDADDGCQTSDAGETSIRASRPRRMRGQPVASMRLRKPSTSAAIVTSLKLGTEVSIVERRGDWVRAEIDADAKALQGWVFGTYLDESAEQAADKSKPQAPFAPKRSCTRHAVAGKK